MKLEETVKYFLTLLVVVIYVAAMIGAIMYFDLAKLS